MNNRLEKTLASLHPSLLVLASCGLVVGDTGCVVVVVAVVSSNVKEERIP